MEATIDLELLFMAYNEVIADCDLRIHDARQGKRRRIAEDYGQRMIGAEMLLVRLETALSNIRKAQV